MCPYGVFTVVEIALCPNALDTEARSTFSWISELAKKCRNNMKRHLCGYRLAIVYKYVETVLLIEFVDMELDPESRRHTVKVDVHHAVIVN